jgi:hypothetical protein
VGYGKAVEAKTEKMPGKPSCREAVSFNPAYRMVPP